MKLEVQATDKVGILPCQTILDTNNIRFMFQLAGRMIPASNLVLIVKSPETGIQGRFFVTNNLGQFHFQQGTVSYP